MSKFSKNELDFLDSLSVNQLRLRVAKGDVFIKLAQTAINTSPEERKLLADDLREQQEEIRQIIKHKLEEDGEEMLPDLPVEAGVTQGDKPPTQVVGMKTIKLSAKRG